MVEMKTKKKSRAHAHAVTEEAPNTPTSTPSSSTAPIGPSPTPTTPSSAKHSSGILRKGPAHKPVTNLTRIQALLWKNWVLRKRGYCLTCLEVAIVPAVVLVIFLIWVIALSTSMSGGTSSSNYTNSSAGSGLYRHYDFKALASSVIPLCSRSILAYTSSNNFTEQIMNSVQALAKQALGFSTISAFKSYKSEASIEEILRTQFSNQKDGKFICVALIFGDEFKEDRGSNQKFSYTIRIAGDATDTTDVFAPFNEQALGAFILMQVLVDSSLIDILDNTINAHKWFRKVQMNEVSLVGINLSRNDISWPVLINILINLGYMFLVPTIMLNLAGEKRSGIKELMRTMGIPNWLHLLTWMINFVATVLISTLLVTAIISIKVKGGTVGPLDNPFLTWLHLFLFVLASISLCVFMVSFFENALLATSFGIAFWVITFSIAISLRSRLQGYHPALKILMAFIPNFAYGMYTNLRSQPGFEQGINFGNFLEPPEGNKKDWVTPAHFLLVMFLSIPLYLLLAQYAENIFPHTYGVRQPFYYPLLPSTWCKCGNSPPTQESNKSAENTDKNFEAEPTELELGVEVRHVTKEYSHGKIAVDDVSLNVYKGQVTALLGANGAGKTTLLSIISGSLSPTEGTVLINGHDVRTDLEAARESFGLCPQDNLLFDSLTVLEHFQFFGKIKGVDIEEKDLRHVNHMVYKLGLQERLDTPSKHLSMGQKRKLSLALAFIGLSQLVILDEPTSGLDPEARRQVWDLILEFRRSRTLILTTSFMEEADSLGDRIAIMSFGKLKCCGSTGFLKRRFGDGYVIRLTIKLKVKADTDKILALIHQHVPDAKSLQKGSHHAFEEIFSIPDYAGNATLPQLFTDLEKKKEELKIESIGVSYTTMDDVFIKIVKQEEVEMQEKMSSAQQSVMSKPSDAPLALEDQKGLKESRVRIKSAEPSRESHQDMVGPSLKVKKPSRIHKRSNRIGSAKTSSQSLQFQKPKASNIHHKSSSKFSSVNKKRSKKHTQEQDEIEIMSILHQTQQKNAGVFLIWQQFCAILIKRFLCSIRRRMLLACLIILPLMSALLGIFIVRKELRRGHSYQLPKLVLSLSPYRTAVTSYQAKDEVKKLGTIYSQVVGHSAKEFSSSDERLEDDLGQMVKKNPDKYRPENIVAARFESNTELVAIFSTATAHAPPLSLNLLATTYLRWTTGRDYTIEVADHPLEIGIPTLFFAPPFDNYLQLKREFSIYFALGVTAGLIIGLGTLTIFPTEERELQAKHLQFMTGIHSLTFWSASFLFDCTVTFLIAALVVLILAVGGPSGCFTSNHGIPALLAIMLTLTFTCVAAAYLISFAVSSGSKGFAVFVLVNSILALILIESHKSLESHYLSPYPKQQLEAIISPNESKVQMWELVTRLQVPERKVVRFAVALTEWLGRLLPFTAGVRALTTFGSIAAANARCTDLDQRDKVILCNLDVAPELESLKACCRTCDFKAVGLPTTCIDGQPYCHKTISYFSWSHICRSHINGTNWDLSFPGIFQELLLLFIEGLLFLAFIIFLDSGILQGYLTKQWGKARPISADELDEDVLKEQQRVQHMVELGPFTDAIALEGILKMFGQFKAVDRLTFGVKEGDCFGLLGVNGAGKTTTFRIITGAILPTAGNAYMLDVESLTSNRKAFLQRIGYCPQADAFFGILTGKENLRLFARLRGEKHVAKTVDAYLVKFGLNDGADIASEKYSAGQRRRLSAAIAMIGDPPVILLDEPTSGVDPVSRRQFWHILRSSQKSGQAVILTSHSMEECEVLCSRVGIMVNGQFRCLGGVGKVKQKFGQGFIFIVRLKMSKDVYLLDAIQKETIQAFKPCYLEERHRNLFHFRSTNTEMVWGKRFEIANNLKAKYKNVIEDYSLNEASLEEIFLSFARAQRGDRKKKESPFFHCFS